MPQLRPARKQAGIEAAGLDEKVQVANRPARQTYLVTVGEAFTFFNRSQETLEFAAGKVSLGWVTEIAHSARLDNLGELRTWYDSGGDGRIEVRLAPANNNQMTVRLSGAREETDVDPVAPIPTMN